ncbi:hypothetical protein ig2599ANME_1377 [groundwater metagenome]
MTRLAEAGGGGYLRRDAAHGIRVLFGEKEIRNSKFVHFVSRNLIKSYFCYKLIGSEDGRVRMGL